MRNRGEPSRYPQVGPWAISVAIVVLGLGFSPAPQAAEDRIDLQLEQEFDGLLKKLQESLEPNVRLVPARHYTPTEDGGYTVYAIRDTAGPESLKTERLQMQIRRDASNKWHVAEPKVEDSTERLFRESREARQFFRFGSVGLTREGLSIAGSGGTALAYHRQGKLSRIIFSAPNLEYTYKPPEDLGTHRVLYRAMPSEWSGDFVFSPVAVEIACDPASCQEALSAFTDLEETDRQSVSDTLARHHEEKRGELQASLTDDPFLDFRLPDGEDKRHYEISVHRDNEHAISLEYDSLSDHEIRFSAGHLGTIYGYPSEVTRRGGDPIAVERRDDGDGELYDLTGLTGTVELGLVESELVQADITFTITAKRRLEAIPFSLTTLLLRGQSEKKATLHVNDLRNGEGRPLSWVRRGNAEGIVLLPEAVAPGSKTVVRMQFQTKGSLVKFNASYSYLARSGWLPFVRYHDQIEDFDLTVKTPSRYTVLGVGTAVGEPKKQGRTTVSRWVADSPIHFPTVIFGDYQSDSPKTKATKADGTEIPVTVYVDKTAMTQWGIRPGQLRSPGEVAVNALNVYRELFGTDYPYGKLDLVNDPLQPLGAQAPDSIVYLGSAIFRSEAALSNVFVGDMTSVVEERISHEVAHQWWGSLVGSANRRNYWFVESLAEYSSALFMEILESEGYQKPEKGRKAYLAHVSRWRDDILNSGLLCSVQDASTLWDNNGYVAAVYDRGPYAFHMLRETFGDKKFFGFLKTLSRKFAGREIVSREIQTIAEQAFGGVQNGKTYAVDLEWFFDQWIRGVGIPEYRFQHQSRKGEDGSYIVEGKIGQRVFAGRHDLELKGIYYRGVVPVTVRGNDKQEYSARVVVEGPETPFAFKVPAKPLEVTLNSKGEILTRRVIVD